MSAGMKAFIEAAAKIWFALAWKDKVAVATHADTCGSGPRTVCVNG
jgi:hypothetical protein